nr:unnamed protein product [Fasciola hepatica]
MNMKSTSNNHLDILQYPCDISSIHYFLAGFRRGGIHSASSYVYSQGTNSMNPGSQPELKEISSFELVEVKFAQVIFKSAPLTTLIAVFCSPYKPECIPNNHVPKFPYGLFCSTNNFQMENLREETVIKFDLKVYSSLSEKLYELVLCLL